MPHLSRRSLLSGAPFLLRGQAPTYTADLTVVNVFATVRDGNGHVVKDLARDDFLLLEDGRRQSVSYFSRESDLPLTIGILVDTSHSQIDVIESERTASYRFLDQVLREDKDLAFVAHFDTRVEILQRLTSSRKDLADALARLSVPDDVATLIYSCILRTSNNPMRQQQGRKAFVLLSDGVQYLDKTSIDDAIEAAQRADTIIFSILFSGTYPNPTRFPSIAIAITKRNGRTAMQRLAHETGGEYYEVSQHNSIEQILTAIEEALRNQYSLGYTPQVSSKSGKYHKLKLTTKKAGLLVHAREGYYSK